MIATSSVKTTIPVSTYIVQTISTTSSSVPATAFGVVSTEIPTATTYRVGTQIATAFGAVETETESLETETVETNSIEETFVVEATSTLASATTDLVQPTTPASCGSSYKVVKRGEGLVVYLICKPGCDEIKDIRIVQVGKCRYAHQVRHNRRSKH